MNYVIWEVREREYKLKLSTQAVCELEKTLNKPLLSVMVNNDLPSLDIMLLITHKAMLKFNHKIKKTDIFDIYDDYLEEGGNIMQFYEKVFFPIFKVSGFFPEGIDGIDEDESEEEAGK